MRQENEDDNVVPMQRPAPLPAEIPFGTPNPEDTIIEILDDGKEDKDDADIRRHK